MELVPRMDTHIHSEYSNIRFLDSINRIPDILKRAVETGLTGVCITDHEALCGHVQALNITKKMKEKGTLPKDFKLGLGNEIYLVDKRGKHQPYYHFILIAKDNIGYAQLRKLSSKAWYESYTDHRLVLPTQKSEIGNLIGANPGHVIATTACVGGEFGSRILNWKQTSDDEEFAKACQLINWGKRIFGDDFYVEVAPSCSPDQIAFNKIAKQFCEQRKLKMIFATDAHYLKAEDRYVHKAYLTSENTKREVDAFYAYAHMMSQDEAFENLIKTGFTEEDCVEMCANSEEIRNKIGEYDIFHAPIIPKVTVKNYEKRVFDARFQDKYETLTKLFKSDNEQERYWVNECYNKLEEKNLVNDIYLSRLDVEGRIIKTIGEKLENCLFEYFNTFQHFIDLFWECGSIVGPGRGSSVCFLSNYLLGITQVDPIEYNLMYWRFLNEERVELPDIDIDLCPSKRKLIFSEIRKERGELNVVQVATFGTEKTRSAILCACRGYRSEEYPNGIDTDVAQYLSSMIPSFRGFLWPLKDVIEGNEEEDRNPIQSFIDSVNMYPGLLDIMKSIEGLICRRGQHASGIMIYNKSPFETNALMRSPNGDITTQFDLHDSEQLGDTKFDFLLTSICDKICNTMDLLNKDGYFSDCKNKREIYNKILHPEQINLDDARLWDALASGEVLSVFQFATDVGLVAAKSIKPRNPIELTMANALMRLMGEKGKERPIDRYIRMKNDPQEWYKEIEKYHFSEKEKGVLEKYYLPRGGTPALQEDLMLVCMDSDIAHFSLKEANAARKIVAKKKMKEIPTLKEKFISQCQNKKLGQYVWETCAGPQMGYSFALPHSLAYSFVAIQTLILATNFPRVYWNCACLITDSGADADAEEKESDLNDFDELEDVRAVEEEDDDDEYSLMDFWEDMNSEEDEDEIEEAEDLSTKKKKKTRSTDYGKIATAIGQMQKAGISVLPPDIEKSELTFIPDVETNSIIYGIKGINKIGADVINAIIANRPYSSYEDFRARVKTNKTQLLNLIKSGAFDRFGDREQLMKNFLSEVAGTKKTVNLRNAAMIIKYGLWPEEIDLQRRVFNFGKAIKAKAEDPEILPIYNEHCLRFYSDNFDVDYLNVDDNNQYFISKKAWERQYKVAMDPAREYFKAHCEELCDALNAKLIEEVKEKYAQGGISKWEIDSISFYYHRHELADVDRRYYNLSNFYNLPEEPEVINLQNGGHMMRLTCIVGTVIDKNITKKAVTLLTPSGVVTIKVYQAQFAEFNKQLSVKLPDGKKKVVEKSWFTRGNKLLVTGFRRGEYFIPKKYKNTNVAAVIQKINAIQEDGKLDLQSERVNIG